MADNRTSHSDYRGGQTGTGYSDKYGSTTGGWQSSTSSTARRPTANVGTAQQPPSSISSSTAWKSKVNVGTPRQPPTSILSSTTWKPTANVGTVPQPPSSISSSTAWKPTANVGTPRQPPTANVGTTWTAWKPKVNVGTARQPPSSISSSTAWKPKVNVGTPRQPPSSILSSTTWKPTANVGTPRQPPSSISSSTAWKPKANVGTARQPPSSISSSTAWKPTANVGTARQPPSSISSSTAWKPKANFGTARQPPSSISSSTTWKPTANVGTPRQPSTANVGTTWTAWKPTANVGAVPQPPSSISSSTAWKPTVNVGTARQPPSSISSSTAWKPTVNVGTARQPPTVNVGTPRQPPSSISSSTTWKLMANVGTAPQPPSSISPSTLWKPLVNVGTPRQPLTANVGTARQAPSSISSSTAWKPTANVGTARQPPMANVGTAQLSPTANVVTAGQPPTAVTSSTAWRPTAMVGAAPKPPSLMSLEAKPKNLRRCAKHAIEYSLKSDGEDMKKAYLYLERKQESMMDAPWLDKNLQVPLDTFGPAASAVATNVTLFISNFLTKDMSREKVTNVLAGAIGVLDVSIGRHENPVVNKMGLFVNMLNDSVAQDLIMMLLRRKCKGYKLTVRRSIPSDYERMEFESMGWSEFEDPTVMPQDETVHEVPGETDEQQKIRLQQIMFRRLDTSREAKLRAIQKEEEAIKAEEVRRQQLAAQVMKQQLEAAIRSREASEQPQTTTLAVPGSGRQPGISGNQCGTAGRQSGIGGNQPGTAGNQSASVNQSVASVGVPCELEEQINGCPEPVIGLSWISLPKPEKKMRPFYSCSLCNIQCPAGVVVAHITGLQHRSKHMEMYDIDEYVKIDQIKSRSERRTLAGDYAKMVEQKNGRETMPAKLVTDTRAMFEAGYNPREKTRKGADNSLNPGQAKAANKGIVKPQAATQRPAIANQGVAVANHGVVKTMSQTQSWQPLADTGQESVNQTAATNMTTKSSEPRRTQVKAKLYTLFKGMDDVPLVGLSYVTELQDDSSSEPPNYRCRLCDKTIAFNLMMIHLRGYQHMSSYLKGDFPLLFDNVGQKTREVEAQVKEIEKMFGRESITVASKSNPDGIVVPVSGVAVYDTQPDPTPPTTLTVENTPKPAEVRPIMFHTLVAKLKRSKPLLGLGSITEIQSARTTEPPKYKCNMCSASCLTCKTVISHVTSWEHRLQFFKERQKEVYNVIVGFRLTKGMLAANQKAAIAYENKHGREAINVTTDTVDIVAKYQQYESEGGIGSNEKASREPIMQPGVRSSATMQPQRNDTPLTFTNKNVGPLKFNESKTVDESRQFTASLPPQMNDAPLAFSSKTTEPPKVNETEAGIDVKEILEEKADKDFDWKKETETVAEKIKIRSIVPTLRPSKFETIYGESNSKIIGISWLIEIQKQDICDDAWYMCNLCEEKIEWGAILVHCMSIRHRILHMEMRFKDMYDMILKKWFKDVDALRETLEYFCTVISKKEQSGKPRVMMELSNTSIGTAIRGMRIADTKKESTYVTQHDTFQRQRALVFVKVTPEYSNYLKVVPREERIPVLHPMTPDPFENLTNRTWDLKMQDWHIMLDKYKPSDGAPAKRAKKGGDTPVQESGHFDKKQYVPPKQKTRATKRSKKSTASFKPSGGAFTRQPPTVQQKPSQSQNTNVTASTQCQPNVSSASGDNLETEDMEVEDTGPPKIIFDVQPNVPKSDGDILVKKDVETIVAEPAKHIIDYQHTNKNITSQSNVPKTDGDILMKKDVETIVAEPAKHIIDYQHTNKNITSRSNVPKTDGDILMKKDVETIVTESAKHIIDYQHTNKNITSQPNVPKTDGDILVTKDVETIVTEPAKHVIDYQHTNQNITSSQPGIVEAQPVLNVPRIVDYQHRVSNQLSTVDATTASKNNSDSLTDADVNALMEQLATIDKVKKLMSIQKELKGITQLSQMGEAAKQKSAAQVNPISSAAKGRSSQSDYPSTIQPATPSLSGASGRGRGRGVSTPSQNVSRPRRNSDPLIRAMELEDVSSSGSGGSVRACSLESISSSESSSDGRLRRRARSTDMHEQRGGSWSRQSDRSHSRPRRRRDERSVHSDRSGSHSGGVKHRRSRSRDKSDRGRERRRSRERSGVLPVYNIDGVTQVGKPFESDDVPQSTGKPDLREKLGQPSKDGKSAGMVDGRKQAAERVAITDVDPPPTVAAVNIFEKEREKFLKGMKIDSNPQSSGGELAHAFTRQLPVELSATEREMSPREDQYVKPNEWNARYMDRGREAFPVKRFGGYHDEDRFKAREFDDREWLRGRLGPHRPQSPEQSPVERDVEFHSQAGQRPDMTWRDDFVPQRDDVPQRHNVAATRSNFAPRQNKQTHPNIRPSGPNIRPSGPNIQLSGPNIRLSGSNIRPSGPNIRSSGPNIRHSGPNIRLSGSNIRPSGPNIRSSGPNIRPSGPNIQLTGPNNRPTGPSKITTPSPNTVTPTSDVTRTSTTKTRVDVQVMCSIDIPDTKTVGDAKVDIANRGLAKDSEAKSNVSRAGYATKVTTTDTKSITTKDTVAKSSVTKDNLAKSITTKDTVAKSPVTKVNVAKSISTKNTLAKFTTTKDIVANSSVTKDIVAKSSVTKDIVAKSSVTKDIVANSSVTKDIVANSSVTKDIVAKSSVTKDIVANSSVTKDIVAKSSVTKDIVAKSPVTKDTVTKSRVTQGTVAKSLVTKDAVAKSIATKDPVAKSRVTATTEDAVDKSTTTIASATKPAFTKDNVSNPKILKFSVTKTDTTGATPKTKILTETSASKTGKPKQLKRVLPNQSQIVLGGGPPAKKVAMGTDVKVAPQDTKSKVVSAISTEVSVELMKPGERELVRNITQTPHIPPKCRKVMNTSKGNSAAPVTRRPRVQVSLNEDGTMRVKKHISTNKKTSSTPVSNKQASAPSSEVPASDQQASISTTNSPMPDKSNAPTIYEPMEVSIEFREHPKTEYFFPPDLTSKQRSKMRKKYMYMQ